MMTQPYDEDIALEDSITWLRTHTNFPSFDEFKKNPDKWRSRPEEIFESADASTISLREKLKSQKYSWKDQYVCDSLEQLERIAKEEGFSPTDLEMMPKARSQNGTSADGDIEIIVEFWPKNDVRQMGGIVTND